MSVQKIPIRNIYYLLAYAWDHFRSGEIVDIDQSKCPDIHNLLAMILANGVRRLATRGIDRDYFGVVEETPRLRGRLQLVQSYRRLTHLSGRLICEFDELTTDTLPNQILKATCQRLLTHSSQLTKENRSSIHKASDLLSGISPIQITGRCFYRIQLHRNNRHYRLLLHICQLLHELYLPEQDSGDKKFRNILDEETVMHRVFETFVRQFAIRHCPDAKVSAMKIKWIGNGVDAEEVKKVLPWMITDVTLDRPDRKMILDCKFYRDALVTRNDRHRLHSSHLYQLVSYLKNKSHEEKWENVAGILLYPAVEHNTSLKFELLGHSIGIYSIDLDQSWPTIHSRLIGILR